VVNQSETIGFVGLGVMGKPMASRLVAVGYKVLVHNRSRAAVNELESLGAVPASSLPDLAAGSDVLITMLPDTPDVEEVVLGPEGLFTAASSGSLFIDMSTVAPELARRIAESAKARGIQSLDAPVSGGEAGAIEGTLSVMCGGAADAVERARPIFSHLAMRVVHVGNAGAGQVVKACNQIVVGISLQAMAEALVLGTKAGIDASAIVEALLGGAARCWALEVKAPQVLVRDFQPGFRARLHHKDLGIALDSATQLSVVLPVTASVRELYRALIATGRGDLDHSALLLLLEDLCGLRGARQSSPLRS
jgi:2-hydroxy-3-oxopropionate reductase